MPENNLTAKIIHLQTAQILVSPTIQIVTCTYSDDDENKNNNNDNNNNNNNSRICQTS